MFLSFYKIMSIWKEILDGIEKEFVKTLRKAV